MRRRRLSALGLGAAPHRLAVAPRHEESVDRIVDGAEVGAALLTGDGALAVTSRPGIAQGGIEDHPPPEAEVMWRRESRTAVLLVHRPFPPVTSMHRRSQQGVAEERFSLTGAGDSCAGSTGPDGRPRTCHFAVERRPPLSSQLGNRPRGVGPPGAVGLCHDPRSNAIVAGIIASAITRLLEKSGTGTS
jgi:hypothetical protein